MCQHSGSTTSSTAHTAFTTHAPVPQVTASAPCAPCVLPEGSVLVCAAAKAEAMTAALILVSHAPPLLRAERMPSCYPLYGGVLLGCGFL